MESPPRGRAGKVKSPYTRPPCNEQEIQAVRKAQVERVLSKVTALSEDSNRCSRCRLLHRVCICTHLVPLPVRHSVTTIIHPCELSRTTSTHMLLRLGLERSKTAVWNTPGSESVTTIMQRVISECAVTGQAPVVLYPCPGAVHVGDHYASLDHSTRAAGLHIVVIDGTWSNARCIAREVSALLLHAESAVVNDLSYARPHSELSGLLRVPPVQPVFVTPRQPFTLFHPLRTQPSPGRVSTVEAIALVLDDCKAVDSVAPSGPSSVSPSSHDPGLVRSWRVQVGYDGHPISQPLDLFSASISHLDAPARATQVHAPEARAALPPTRSWAGNRLRWYLMLLVDASMAQCGEMGPTRPLLQALLPGLEQQARGERGSTLPADAAASPPPPFGVRAWGSPAAVWSAVVNGKHQGVGYRTWTVGGAAPPLTREKYRRMVADAQSPAWWKGMMNRVSERRARAAARQAALAAALTDTAANRAAEGPSLDGQLRALSVNTVKDDDDDAFESEAVRQTILHGGYRAAVMASMPLPRASALGASDMPAFFAGAFSGMPAYLVVHVAEFAYGRLEGPAVHFDGTDVSEWEIAEVMESAGIIPRKPPPVPASDAPRPAGDQSASGSGPVGSVVGQGRVIPCGYPVQLSRARLYTWTHAPGFQAAAAGSSQEENDLEPAVLAAGVVQSDDVDDDGCDATSSNHESMSNGRDGGAHENRKSGGRPDTARDAHVAAAEGRVAPRHGHGFGATRNGAQLPSVLGPHNTTPMALSCRELMLLFSGRCGPASGWGRLPG